MPETPLHETILWFGQPYVHVTELDEAIRGRNEAIRAIQFALQPDIDCAEFLRSWNEGAANEEWPEYKDWSPT